MAKNQIVVLNNLEVDYDRLLAWTREDSFPIKQADENQLKRLKDLVSVFVSFNGAFGNRSIVNFNTKEDYFDYSVNQFYQFIYNYVFYNNISYMLIAEHQVMPRNRIRSYKGILSKEIKESAIYKEVEVEIENGNTMIVAIIEMNKDNAKDLIANYLNNTTGCIINAKSKRLFTDDFLKLIPSKYMNHSGTSTINFLDLIIDYCNLENNICRVGGDGGDEELSFQVFCKRMKKDLVYIQVEEALEA